MVSYMRERHGVSQRAACRALRLSRSLLAYQPVRKDDQLVVAAIGAYMQGCPRDGFGLMHDSLKLRGQLPCGKTRLWRVYCALGYNLKRRGKKRLPDRIREPLISPTAANETWSADFMADALWNGRRFRTFNVLDDYNREALRIEIDTSLPAKRVIRAFDELIEVRGKPKQIRLDNGPEFVSHELADWARARGIRLQFIQKGKPTQNAYIERFNRTYRQAVLDCYVFNTLGEVRSLTGEWLTYYNEDRPHEALGRIPPKSYPVTKSP
jgi:putative transposase